MKQHVYVLYHIKICILLNSELFYGEFGTINSVKMIWKRKWRRKFKKLFIFTSLYAAVLHNDHFCMSLLQLITLINMLMSYLKMYLNLIFQIIYLLWSEKHFIYIFMLFYCFAMICCLILLPCVIYSVCSDSICNIIQYLQLWFHALRVYNLIFLCIIQIELKIFLFNK